MSVASAVRPVLLAGCLALALACSSGSASVHAGTGTIQVHITDAPIDLSTVEKVEVTITDVIVYPGDDDSGMPAVDPAGPIVLTTHPQTFDLLTLTGGVTDLLASGEVPAGDYSRIRLEISDASLTYKDGTTAPLKIDSGKVDVPIGFHVVADAMNNLTLDFDAGASVQVNETATDTLILRPVVTPLPHP
jgi:hypothetical protein